MKQRLLTIAKWAAYPAFYLFCLGLFGYLAFPYDRLKDRLISEFEQAQQKRGSGQVQRLEIDSLDAYWFTGVEVKGARLILPPDPTAARTGDSKDPPKPSVIEFDEAHARVRILPLLLGRVRIDFWASAFGGEVEGLVPVGKSSGAMEIELQNIDLGKVGPLVDMLGMPLGGVVNGKLELEAPEGKFNKANGLLEITATDVVVGDGKTKIQGLIALPEAKLGELALSAEAKEGVLKITKFTGSGPDVELVGDGKVNVREPWNNSTADLYVRFKFSDGYRGKNESTQSILGAPGSSAPPLIEISVPKMKRAKRPDGFYGWHVHGQLKRLKFDPHASDAPVKGRGKTTDSPFGGEKDKKLDRFKLPLGPSEAASPPPRLPKGEEEEPAAPPPEERTPPPPPPEERAPPPPPPPPEPQPEAPPPERMNPGAPEGEPAPPEGERLPPPPE